MRGPFPHQKLPADGVEPADPFPRLQKALPHLTKRFNNYFLATFNSIFILIRVPNLYFLNIVII
jgi:hypothetical protein